MVGVGGWSEGAGWEQQLDFVHSANPTQVLPTPNPPLFHTRNNVFARRRGVVSAGS